MCIHHIHDRKSNYTSDKVKPEDNKASDSERKAHVLAIKAAIDDSYWITY